MKGAIAAAAVAAMATGAQAANHHRHAHNLFKRGVEEVCVPTCTTIWTTYYGEPTLVPNPPPVAKTTEVVAETTTAVVEKTTKVPEPKPQPETTTSEAAPVPTTTSSEKVVTVVPLPTPESHDCPTPGTYTFPATTVTVTESTTVCVGESTKVPSGTHTLGGVTTVVEKETTITCPVAKETEHEGTITSVIETTVFVCPTAGTYTIGPVTKSCDEETVIVYPIPTSYAPGTYTAPEQVVTVTESSYVYVCPYTSEGAPAPTSIVETVKQEKPTYVAPEQEKPTYVAPKQEKPTYVAPKVEKTTAYEAPTVEKTTAYEAPKSTSKPKTSKPSYSGNLKGGNDHYGITYTPYESSNGDCKASSEVDSDIKNLKEAGFEIIRSYSTDCNTLESVGGACRKHGIDMMIGVFVKGSGCSYETPDIKEQVDAIAEWAQWDLVKLFVVGNEAIMNGFCTPTQLSELITVVKSKCSGYTGPYTIAETLNIWERKDVASAICPVVDVTGANIHPYFNSEVEPSTAGEFVSGQLDLLGKICSGNDVINLECGWPTRGECNGSACPGKEEQATAIKSIRESCGDKTVFFSYEDDMWKEPGDCGCEQSWGSKDCF